MITRYGDVVEAKTVQWSSLLCLVHPIHSLISKGVYFSLYYVHSYFLLVQFLVTILIWTTFISSPPWTST